MCRKNSFKIKSISIKYTEIIIQFKPAHYPVKQKLRPIPLHLPEEVSEELDKLIKTGHLGKVKHVVEDCFVSPVIITVKKRQVGGSSFRLEKIDRQLYKNPNKHTKYERTIKLIFGGNYKRPNKGTDDIANRPRLRKRPKKII